MAHDAGKWSRPGLAVLVLTLPIYDALPQLYILSKGDGCGAQADQAVRLLWLADELGYEAGGIIGDANRTSHGWACNSLLRGLGLPQLGAFDTTGCAVVPHRRRQNASSELAQLQGACVVYNVSVIELSNEFYGEGAARTAPLRARFLSANGTTHSLPAPSFMPLGAGRDGAVVAVHIRRGDVVPGSKMALNHPHAYLWPARQTPNAWYAALMTSVPLHTRFGEGLKFHFYSQGSMSDFAELTALGAVLHLGGDPLQAVADFIAADVLVMAKSSFSYIPALFREGPVVYFPHPTSRKFQGWFGAQEFVAADAGGPGSLDAYDYRAAVAAATAAMKAEKTGVSESNPNSRATPASKRDMCSTTSFWPARFQQKRIHRKPILSGLPDLHPAISVACSSLHKEHTTVWIGGAPGTGKTTLAKRFQDYGFTSMDCEDDWALIQNAPRLDALINATLSAQRYNMSVIFGACFETYLLSAPPGTVPILLLPSRKVYTDRWKTREKMQNFPDPQDHELRYQRAINVSRSKRVKTIRQNSHECVDQTIFRICSASSEDEQLK